MLWDPGKQKKMATRMPRMTVQKKQKNSIQQPCSEPAELTQKRAGQKAPGQEKDLQGTAIYRILYM